jgi:hypothetical protein
MLSGIRCGSRLEITFCRLLKGDLASGYFAAE